MHTLNFAFESVLKEGGWAPYKETRREQKIMEKREAMHKYMRRNDLPPLHG